MDINLAGSRNGIESAKSVEKLYHLPIIFNSGYSDKVFFNEVQNVKHMIFMVNPIFFAE